MTVGGGVIGCVYMWCHLYSENKSLWTSLIKSTLFHYMPLCTVSCCSCQPCTTRSFKWFHFRRQVSRLFSDRTQNPQIWDQVQIPIYPKQYRKPQIPQVPDFGLIPVPQLYASAASSPTWLLLKIYTSQIQISLTWTLQISTRSNHKDCPVLSPELFYWTLLLCSL